MKARQTRRTQIACLAFAAIALSLGPAHPIAAEPNDRVSATGSAAEASSKLTRPSDAVGDDDGNLYIADTANHRVQRVSVDGTVTTLAGTGTPGSSGDGGLATEAAMNAPAGIALATDGSIFVSDGRNNRIRRIAPDGVITTVAGRAYGDASIVDIDLRGPSDIALDSSGRLYIADSWSHRIVRVDLSNRKWSVVAGTGQPGFSNEGGSATSAKLEVPKGLTIDFAGNLFIADTGNNVIRRVDATTGFITTVAGRQQAGRHGDGGEATASYLFGPMGIDFDDDGNLFIADTYNDLVRRVDADSGRIGTVTLRSGELARPTAVDITESGMLVVTDTGNDRVISMALDGLLPDPAGPSVPAGIEFDPSIGGELGGATGNSGLVARLYMAVFSRQPDGAGFDYWVEAMRLGAGEATVASSFVASQEFATTYDGLGDEAFLDRIYVNVMGRVGDSAGRAYWLSQMERGMDRASVLLYFADSTEFRALTGTN